jgi:DNA-binding response OmpR family regulator
MVQGESEGDGSRTARVNEEASVMSKCILVVDDDAMNLKRTKMILERQYKVLLAESGREALDKIKTEEIDLVLLDIAMPAMDGLETFQHMKEASVDVPVIFLTASGYEDDVRTAISMGAVNYLKKPFFPNELLKRVAMGLEEQ